jgi:hypothetical protein
MKNMKVFLALTVAMAAFAASVQAQTPAAPLPGQFFGTNLPAIETSFLTQLTTWGTALNTNADHNWTNSSFQIDTGTATVTGSGISDRLQIQKNIGAFGFGAVAEFVGVGSSIGELQGRGSYSIYQKYDLKIDFLLGGGWDFNTAYDSVTMVSQGKGQPPTRVTKQEHGAIVVEPGIGLSKMMTYNTYATAQYSFPIESHGKFNAAGVIYAGLGVSFW